MSISMSLATARGRSGLNSPAAVRAAYLFIVLAVMAVGLLATGEATTAAAVAHDGAALTRLMRFMAALKGLLALAAGAAVLWRLGAAIPLPWFGAYAVATAAMAAGPGLIWGMTHVALGALLLHGGLFATILLLWRDPMVGDHLAALIATRRAAG
jgi:hypothetical protein